MIQALFLVCALAPQPMAFAGRAKITAHHAVVQSAEFILRKQTDTEKLFLVVGGDPAITKVFRAHGMRAFGALTDDWPGATAWHAVSNADYISFQSRLFSTVYWMTNNPAAETCYDWLKEAVRLTGAEGFLIFNEEAYEDWPHMLRHWNWDRMPFYWGDYAIWQRPANGNGLSFAYKESLKKMGKVVVPFKQAWAMRQILASA